MKKTWLTTDDPAIMFEDNTVGRLKKELWDASEAEIESILAEYDVPSPSELGKAGTYVQNTPRASVQKTPRLQATNVSIQFDPSVQKTPRLERSASAQMEL